MKNLAAVMVQNNKIEIRDFPMPKVGDNDVLIETKHVGLCGSDVTYFQDYTYGGARPDNKLPIYLGHEVSGMVIKKGKKVDRFKIGDRVALEPSVACMECEYCKAGRYNLCEHMDMMSAPPFHRFALQKYISHPARNTFLLPDNVSTIEGALLEPLNVGMYAATRGRASLNKTAIILGAGTIGIMTMLACHAYGCKRIFVTDILENRLKRAKEILPEVITINTSEESALDPMLAQNKGKKVDIAFETAGNPRALETTPLFVKRGGCIVTVGNVHGKVDFPFLTANFNEIDIHTIFRYKNLYPLCIEEVASGKINLRGTVSNIFKFEDTQKAFEMAVNHKSEVLKIIVEF